MGAAGSGKSTLLKILVSMFPSERVCSISPLSWDKEYNVAGMAGMALNSVPEIDRDVAIPAATFKSVVGEDLLGARQPYGRVFSFVPTAAQWFCGNSFMTTKDQSEGFWRRWSVIPFSTSVPEQDRIEGLAEQIVETELDRIVGWALQGVIDRQKNGLFTSSDSAETLEVWKDDSDVVRSWLLADSVDHKSELIGMFDVITYVGQPEDNTQKSNAAEVLDRFRTWCSLEGRKPVGRSMFYERMAKLGMPHSRSNGSKIKNINIKSKEPSFSSKYSGKNR
jgi:phage/plasmid-associated DNA primase